MYVHNVVGTGRHTTSTTNMYHKDNVPSVPPWLDSNKVWLSMKADGLGTGKWSEPVVLGPGYRKEREIIEGYRGT